VFYTSLVISVVRDLAWSLLCISGVVVAIYGYIAATAGAGRRKGRARLIAALAFISWLVVPPSCGPCTTRSDLFTNGTESSVRCR
jgi:hypothetical protein